MPNQKGKKEQKPSTQARIKPKTLQFSEAGRHSDKFPKTVPQQVYSHRRSSSGSLLGCYRRKREHFAESGVAKETCIHVENALFKNRVLEEEQIQQRAQDNWENF